MSWFSPLTEDQKATLEWAKKRMENPQGGTVTAVPNDDILQRVKALEAKSEDKSDASKLKTAIIEETEKSRNKLSKMLEKKMGEMSAAASMKLTAEVGEAMKAAETKQQKEISARMQKIRNDVKENAAIKKNAAMIKKNAAMIKKNGEIYTDSIKEIGVGIQGLQLQISRREKELAAAQKKVLNPKKKRKKKIPLNPNPP